MQAQLLHRGYNYIYGWHLGRDGKPHVGFDEAETEVGGHTELVKAFFRLKKGHRSAIASLPFRAACLRGSTQNYSRSQLKNAWR